MRRDMCNFFTKQSQTNMFSSGKGLQSWCVRSSVRIPSGVEYLLNFPTCSCGTRFKFVSPQIFSFIYFFYFPIHHSFFPWFV
jgi:hypothetical protein